MPLITKLWIRIKRKTVRVRKKNLPRCQPVNFSYVGPVNTEKKVPIVPSGTPHFVSNLSTKEIEVVDVRKGRNASTLILDCAGALKLIKFSVDKIATSITPKEQPWVGPL